jgi:cytoskeletal protein CcmA (bactofilin family)
MTGGLVEGNITCRELIIDGCVIGQCRSETIEIDKNGNVTGTLAYRTLAIKRAAFFPARQNCCRRQIRATSWGLSRIPLLKLKIRLRRSSSHPGAAEKKQKKPAPGWLK